MRQKEGQEKETPPELAQNDLSQGQISGVTGFAFIFEAAGHWGFSEFQT